MPSKTQDIEFAIETEVKPGETITLAELDTRLYAAYPALAEIDRRWVGAAVSTMISDGRLVPDDAEASYSDDYRVTRAG